MALQDTSTVSGTIQKYFEKSWMDRPQEDFKTPLANSKFLESATIPMHSGQYAEFRKFDHFTVETDTDDSPKTYKENTEPSSPVTQSASLVQVSFEMLADYVEIGNIAAASDPIDLIKKAKDGFYLLVRRKMHQVTNGHFVKGVVRVLNASDAIPPATTYLPQGFRVLYCGGVTSFNDLTPDNVFTMAVLKRARSLLANANVPRFANGRYACFIDEAVKDQLLEDPEFKDAVKRHEDKYQKAHVNGEIADHEGMTFVLQDDGYRCHLPDASGALTTRANSGNVHVAHVIGRNAAGYVDFGDKNVRRTLKPTFKVQDTSYTGTGPSIGWRIAFQGCVIDRKRGLNIAGTTRFDETVEDIVE